jgi:superoxide reductase
MQRRNFIRMSMASAGVGMIAPVMSLAANKKPVTPGADIYYTNEAPGRWAGKVATHLPTIEIGKADAEISIKVITAHEMIAYEHYIVKHVLLDQDYKFINEHLFDPAKENKAISNFTLSKYSGTLYALSMCNKHDLWINSIEI